MEEVNYYCWSCGKAFPYPREARNCRECNKLFMMDRKRINTVCRRCHRHKERNRRPLCCDCYLLIREKNMKGY